MPSMDDRHKANGARLNRLLIDLGTEAMRMFFDSIHHPATLTAALITNHALLLRLQRRGVVKPDQMLILFPPIPLVPSKSGDYDITLLYILLRNICGLHPPTSTGSWDRLPPLTDPSLEADLARIKYYRNKIYGHITNTKVDDVKFQSYWNDISGALSRRGISANEIRKIKTNPLEENKNRQFWRGAVLLIVVSLLFIYVMLPNFWKEVQISSALDFSSRLNILKEDFIGRELIFRELEEAVNRTQFDVVILGDPGSGKSAIMSQLISSPTSSPFIHNNIVGYHLCKFDEERTRDGTRFVNTLVEQLSRIPEYESVIKQQRFQNELKNNCEKDPVGCFDTIIFEPLTTIKLDLQDTTKFIIIDALDECIEKSEKRSQILTIVQNKMTKLPSWIKLIITSRNKTSLIAKLPTFEKVVINSTDQRNLNDIRSYVDHVLLGNDRFKNESVMECVENLIEQLNNTKEGNFLYFKTLLQYLKKNDCYKPGQVPQTLDELYGRSFRDRFLKEDFERFAPLFEVLLASNAPPTITELEAILIFRNDEYNTRRIIKQVSEFLDERDGTVRFYHKSFADWLVTQAEDSDGLFIKKSSGHQYIVNYLLEKINTTLTLQELSELSMHVLFGGMQEGQVKKLLDLNVGEIWEPRTGKYILHVLAEKRKSTKIIEKFLKKFDSVDMLDTNGLTPLWYATGSGSFNNVKLFIDNGADLYSTHHNNWFNPISEIAAKGYTEIAEFLIDNGADFDKENRFREKPMTVAAKSGHLDLVELLIDKGVEADVIALHHAAGNNHSNIVRFLLRNKIRDECLECKPDTNLSSCLTGENLNFQQFHQCFCETALHAAVHEGHLHIAELLLSHGKDSLECKRRSGKTPLLEAAERNDTEMAILLLNEGANIDAVCEDSINENDYLVDEYEFAKSKKWYYHSPAYIKDKGVCPWGTQSIHHFARHKSWEMVKGLISRWKANPFSENLQGLTSVSFAIMQDRVDLIQYFNATYPVMMTKFITNDTVQRHMTLCGSVEILKLLISIANTSVLQTVYEDGMTLLHLATQWSPYPPTVLVLGRPPLCPQVGFFDVRYVNDYKKRLTIVKLLTKLQQNIVKKDKHGRTALHYAAENGFAGAVRHLLRQGSNWEAKGYSVIRDNPLALALKESPSYPLHFLPCRTTNDGVFQSCNSTMYDETARSLIIQQQSLIKKCRKGTKRLLRTLVEKNMPLSLYTVLKIGVDTNCEIELFKTHLAITRGPIGERSREISEVFKIFQVNVTVECGIPFVVSELHLMAYLGKINDTGNFFKLSIDNRSFPLQKLIHIHPKGIRIFDECRDEEGYLAIHRAVQGGNADAVGLFISLGVDISKKTRSGWNALDLSIFYLVPERFSRRTLEEDDLSHLVRFFFFRKHHQPLYVQISRQHDLPDYTEAAFLVQDLRELVFEKLLEQSLKTISDNGSTSFSWCKSEFTALSPLHIAASRGMEMLQYVRKKARSLPIHCTNKHGVRPRYMAYLYENIENAETNRKIFLETPGFPIEGRSLQYPERNAEYHLIYNHFFQTPVVDLSYELDVEGLFKCHGINDFLPKQTAMERLIERCSNSCGRQSASQVSQKPSFLPQIMESYCGSRKCRCVEIMRLLQKQFFSQPRRNKRVGKFVAKRMGWNDTSPDGDVMYRWPFRFLLMKALKTDKEYEYLKIVGEDLEPIVS
ncbi:Ankyrin repeat domain-containing 50 [Paramuricea clavata]|uniref:Ankyrin repeat domain-containing 50 n=1 Tax=Paramuricea clavata TaxID=317549 RepID=A0A6S7IPV8_PARCT|nr:Ankyrin repeat domain-containing 50 [Paramuricea clavata]